MRYFFAKSLIKNHFKSLITNHFSALYILIQFDGAYRRPMDAIFYFRAGQGSYIEVSKKTIKAIHLK